MTSPAALSRRHARLEEIRSIMQAIKNLSLVETRKLSRFAEHQRRMLSNIEEAAADFLHFHPPKSINTPMKTVLVLVGSERGFCGNFNEQILMAWRALPIRAPSPEVVTVGQRLCRKLVASLPENSKQPLRVEGASVAEEVPAVLVRLMEALVQISPQTGHMDRDLLWLGHDDKGEVQLKRLLPWVLPPTPVLTQPPGLLLAPEVFLARLLAQYLPALLHGLLYDSLAAENHQRLAHMEHATTRLDETLAEFALRRNAVRQERIIEEIEIMLAGEQHFT